MGRRNNGQSEQWVVGICVSTFIFGCLPVLHCGTGRHPNMNVETQIPYWN